MAAEPTLYQRHLTFPSQAKLFDWVEKGEISRLQRIRTLSIALTDIDLSRILARDVPGQPGHSSAWDLYQHELERLDHGFQSMSNLSALTIRPPDLGHSQLLRGMYISALSLIAIRYPRLQRLVVVDSAEVLDRVPELKELSDVRFTVADTEPATTSKDVFGEPRTGMKRQEKSGALGASRIESAKGSPRDTRAAVKKRTKTASRRHPRRL